MAESVITGVWDWLTGGTKNGGWEGWHTDTTPKRSEPPSPPSGYFDGAAKRMKHLEEAISTGCG
jgi:hypothetical protein